MVKHADKPDCPVVTELEVTEFAVRCPHCGERNDGWYFFPDQHEEYACDHCDGFYKVHPDADFEYFI